MKGLGNVGSIHRAALFANYTAIVLVHKHILALNRRFPEQAAPFSTLTNVTCDSGGTVLDWATNTFRIGTPEEIAERPFTHPKLQAARRKDGLKCYEYLRTRGSLHSFELKGVFRR